MPPHLHFIFNSSIAPTTTKSLQSLHFHTGSGVPQYLCLVIPLSLKFASQLSKFLEPADSGTHFIFLFNSRILSFKSSILKNHWFVVLNMTGFLHLQQCAYSWSIFVCATNAPFFLISSVIFLSSIFAAIPENGPEVLSKIPLSVNVLKGGMLFL